jgi:predicted HicB family RNase H-like nuclease
MATKTSRASKRTKRAPRNVARVPVSKAGTAVTEALAEKLADEAERGYDLSRGRRVGRPSLAGRGASPRVNFRTTPALHDRARRLAAKEGKTVSALAREALEEYLGR